MGVGLSGQHGRGLRKTLLIKPKTMNANLKLLGQDIESNGSAEEVFTFNK